MKLFWQINTIDRMNRLNVFCVSCFEMCFVFGLVLVSEKESHTGATLFVKYQQEA